MSLEDGMAVVNLEMPARIPRVEFDAETLWELLKKVTGIKVNVESPDEMKTKATRTFIQTWNYDIGLEPLIGDTELNAKRTCMGHAEYAAGGIDYNDNTYCPFKTPDEVFAFDPWETYGAKNKNELIRRFNEHYLKNCELYPDLVNMTGTYVTLFSGFISIFGWDMLLTAGGLEPVALGEVTNRYASWMMQFYEALAESETPVIYSHDDIVWTLGAVFHPQRYRKYIFLNYKKYYALLIEAGKKVIFISDGNYSEFIDDVAAAHGFFFEPLTDLNYIVEHYGKSHIIIGNAYTRILLSGTKKDIRCEVEHCISVGKKCPGYFMGVTNMIPHNTPVENALYYNEGYEELCWR